MAEAFLRKYGGTEFEIYSAGLTPLATHPLAKRVMKDIGIEMADQETDPLKKYWGKMIFDYLIVLCEKAEKECFIFPGVNHRLFWPFEDPATHDGPEQTMIGKFRQVRDGIEERVKAWLKENPTAEPEPNI